MPKTIDDIIPPSRKRMMEGMSGTTPSQTNSSPVVPPPTAPSYTPPPTPPDLTTPISSPTPPSMPPTTYIRTGRSFPYGTAIIALIVIALSAGALYAFSGAKVQVTPESQVTDVSGTFTATQGTGDLPYTIVSTTKTASISVPAESTQTSNDSAQGTITISNAQPTAQSLITNTRFQTSAGLIYRIHSAITVPAQTASGPGTLDVTVYADQPGQQYNIGPSSFTVPGLQNSAAYALVTAKSSGPIAGGFSGTRASVSQTTDDSKHTALQVSLATNLQNDLTAKIPTGDVLVPGAVVTSYQTVPDSATTTTSVLVNEQGTMTAVIFPKDALAKAIAYKLVGTYSGEPVTLNSVSQLTLTPQTSGGASSSTPATATSLPTSGPFNFALSGTTTIIWSVDASKIAGAVAGKTRDAAQSILSGFPEVDKAVLILRPFWASTFPADPAHIQVTVTPPASS